MFWKCLQKMPLFECCQASDFVKRLKSSAAGKKHGQKGKCQSWCISPEQQDGKPVGIGIAGCKCNLPDCEESGSPCRWPGISLCWQLPNTSSHLPPLLPVLLEGEMPGGRAPWAPPDHSRSRRLPGCRELPSAPGLMWTQRWSSPKMGIKWEQPAKLCCCFAQRMGRG